MGRKVIAGLWAVLLLCGMTGCGGGKAPPGETAAEPWKNAYAAFLRDPANYKEEDPYHAFGFVLADFDNDSSPELILVYGDDHQGGALFADVYSYSGKVRIVGQKIDMFYKGIYLSTDPAFPGVFVEGGRNSTFRCNYWTIKNNKFVDIPLWTDIADMETHDMVFTELTDNKQLIAEAKKVRSLYPNGIKFSAIDEAAIQMMLDVE